MPVRMPVSMNLSTVMSVKRNWPAMRRYLVRPPLFSAKPKPIPSKSATNRLSIFQLLRALTLAGLVVLAIDDEGGDDARGEHGGDENIGRRRQQHAARNGQAARAASGDAGPKLDQRGAEKADGCPLPLALAQHPGPD